MSHYVLVQKPRRKSYYVICGDVDECLVVVDKEKAITPVGTRITMLQETGTDVLKPLALWRVEKRGQARRYSVNASADHETEIVEGDVIRLSLQRLPVYESRHTSAERKTSQLVTVRKITDDGRILVRMRGKKPGYNAASISVDRSEMSGSGPAGKRPFRYLILGIEKRDKARWYQVNPPVPEPVKSVFEALSSLDPKRPERFAGSVWSISYRGHAADAKELLSAAGWKTFGKKTDQLFAMRKRGKELQVVERYKNVRVTVDLKP